MIRKWEVYKWDPDRDGERIKRESDTRLFVGSAMTHVGVGGKRMAVTTDTDLGIGSYRGNADFGLRVAAWHAALGYTSGFRKRDIAWFVILTCFSLRLACLADRSGWLAGGPEPECAFRACQRCDARYAKRKAS